MNNNNNNNNCMYTIIYSSMKYSKGGMVINTQKTIMVVCMHKECSKKIIQLDNSIESSHHSFISIQLL